MTTIVPPAGWYTDPQIRGTQRFWDGVSWTEQTRPTDYTEQLAEDARGRLTLAWVLAFLFPIVGFFLGWRLTDERPRHGIAVMLVSVLTLICGIWLRFAFP
jgi:hypothetical protein